MDTEDEYRDCDFYVRMAGEPHPDFVQEYHRRRAEHPDTAVVGYEPSPMRDFHVVNEDVPVDGQICFYWPDRLESVNDGNRPFAFEFPFRDHRKDDAPWFAAPDANKFSKHPVWRWKNPDAQRENITLEPSLGIGDPMRFHCYVRGGDIDWL